MELAKKSKEMKFGEKLYCTARWSLICVLASCLLFVLFSYLSTKRFSLFPENPDVDLIFSESILPIFFSIMVALLGCGVLFSFFGGFLCMWAAGGKFVLYMVFNIVAFIGCYDKLYIPLAVLIVGLIIIMAETKKYVLKEHLG